MLKEDIGETVMDNGVEMPGWAWWANKILTLSALAEDPTCTTLCVVRDGMPEMLRKLVRGPFTSWATFAAAVKAVSEKDTASAVAEEKQSTTMENEIKQLHTQILTQGQAPPTALL